MLTTAQIRQKFLAYFANYQHTIVPSSSLVPNDDPSLLFTNAGMVQFKTVFLGQDKRSYVRAASSQRCVRAGGKHNDLENVGYTARHHTFFEMLGNFSFGDYFKRDAIHLAWQFLTVELALPPERLWISVFQDDQETYDIWVQEVKVNPQRVSRCGAQDNFWMMGDTGPCGPCTEIFYDHGDAIAGGPPGSPDPQGDRYIEIWNIVFIQYQRFADGSQTLLPTPSVDTGMGLERIAAVMQNVHDNYAIDIFQYLISAIASIARTDDLQHKSLRVIADHIRAASFLIMDGVLPSNEGRGYVLRRIIRRALRHGNKLGLTQLFFYKLVRPLAKVMSDAYPDLSSKKAYLEKILRQEEQQFMVTLEHGLKILRQAMAVVDEATIAGELAFKLYDTYGFPLDLTADIAREQGFKVDQIGFEQAMDKQRKQSRHTSQFNFDYNLPLKVDQPTYFSGYDRLQEPVAMITGLFNGCEAVTTLSAGEMGLVGLDLTPFYAQSGGQVGDVGLLINDTAEFVVDDTIKIGPAYLHHGLVRQGSLSVGDRVNAQVQQEDRQAIARNHSATHLLHAALRHILGDHVIQQGSLVDAKHLRFDFLYPSALTQDELWQLENLVNQKIRENLAITVDIMSVDDAKKRGAIALFNEKYADEVRVLSMSDFSIELCGGTHVRRTGDIGVLMISEETGIAAGIRRIEAITGQAVINWLQAQRQQHKSLAEQLRATDRTEQLLRIKQLQDKLKSLEKKAQVSSLQNAVYSLKDQAKMIAGVHVVISECSLEAKLLREAVDNLKAAFDKAIIVLAVKTGEKFSLIVGITDNLTQQINANQIIKSIAEKIAVKGGGKANFAQLGGANADQLAIALEVSQQTIQAMLL